MTVCEFFLWCLRAIEVRGQGPFWMRGWRVKVFRFGSLKPTDAEAFTNVVVSRTPYAGIILNARGACSFPSPVLLGSCWADAGSCGSRVLLPCCFGPWKCWYLPAANGMGIFSAISGPNAGGGKELVRVHRKLPEDRTQISS